MQTSEFYGSAGLNREHEAQWWATSSEKQVWAKSQRPPHLSSHGRRPARQHVLLASTDTLSRPCLGYPLSLPGLLWDSKHTHQATLPCGIFASCSNACSTLRGRCSTSLACSGKLLNLRASVSPSVKSNGTSHLGRELCMRLLCSIKIQKKSSFQEWYLKYLTHRLAQAPINQNKHEP